MRTKHLLFSLFVIFSGAFSVAKAQVNISTATISGLEASYLYTGYGIKPALVLTNDSTLTNGVSYTLDYSNNVALGTASVTIKGIGSYTGTTSKTFAIVNATRSIGYNLWDSNGEVVATLDSNYLEPAVQIMHIQIKFDKAITIADAANLRSQFTIGISGTSSPETTSRTVSFGVNSTNPAILDIIIPPVADVSTAQTNNKISITAANLAGWIPAITDTDNNPVNLIAISSIQPTGLSIEKVSSSTGTSSDPASATYKISSLPLVRAMNFIEARSNKSSNANGYIASEFFTFHSHSFFNMNALSHITNLVTSANITTFSNAGYMLEKIDGTDANNPYFKLTAKNAQAGEELSWVVYHYPYRSAADRKFELSQIIDTTTTATTAQIESAKTVLYDIQATASNVAQAIESLKATNGSGITPWIDNAQASISTEGRTICLKGVTPGTNISVYGISGKISASKKANSSTEFIQVPYSGVYVLKAGSSVSKVLVK